MILKDASAYNIQFYEGSPCLIDTPSFEFYNEGSPWGAYGQFCRHFIAPLYLMAKVDVRLSGLMRVYIDGVPIDLASCLMQGRKGGLGAWQHITLHAKSINKHEGAGSKVKKVSEIKISKFSHIALVESLIRIVENLNEKKITTEWGDYYQQTNYSDGSAKKKLELVSSFLW